MYLVLFRTNTFDLKTTKKLLVIVFYTTQEKEENVFGLYLKQTHLTFIDGFSRCTWIALLKDRSELFGVFLDGLLRNQDSIWKKKSEIYGVTMQKKYLRSWSIS